MKILRLPISPAHKELSRLFPANFSLKRGIPVVLLPGGNPGFEITRNKKTIAIQAESLSEYFRALGELAFSSPPLNTRIVAPFEFRGQMIDCSRNGVMHVSALKDSLVELALFGYNKLCLYTEDTYEVKNEPLIGYRRGRYSQNELRQLDGHAALFGIEMFPCIQVLGHLSQVLKFWHIPKARDTDQTLNVNNPETYVLIEKLITNASKPYRSRMIHLGMDETWDLGRGNSFKVGKAMFPRNMFLEHVRKVTALCRKHGLKPMMWGDMLLSTHLGKSPGPSLPKDMNVVYWNYDSNETDNVIKDIRSCRKQGFEPMVAPGSWNWDRFWGHHHKAMRTSAVLLSAAKKSGVKGALNTLWGDEGQEAPYRSNLPTQAHFAQHCWRVKPRLADIKRMTLGVSGGAHYAAFEAANKLDILNLASDLRASNPSKALMYDDLLLRLYASHGKSWDLQSAYERRSQALKTASKNIGKKNLRLFEFIRAVADCLSVKAALGNQAAAAYREGNKVKLKGIFARSRYLSRKIKVAWMAHRNLWLEERKPFGLESIDIRYGGVLLRLEAFRMTLSNYLSGKISRIEEFDEPDQIFLGKFPEMGILWKTHAAVSTISTGR